MDMTPVQYERLQEQKTRYTHPFFLIQIALVVALILMPLVIPSFRVMDVVAKIMIFTVVVASYDLILGYTGILSFAHGMFFGLGAYSVALLTYHSSSPQWYHLFFAVGLALCMSVVLAVVIAFFSLRVKAIFFALVTLALAGYAEILAVQWYDLTMAEDGVSFKLPGIFSVDWSGGIFLGTELNGRLMTYYLILIAAVACFVSLLRFVRSPVGRVLKSIRENEQRSTALGFKTFRYQIYSIVFGSSIASLAGILFAMWLRYVNPDSVLGIGTMFNILLMVIIGGLGTLYGSIIGVTFVNVCETWLPEFLHFIAGMLPGNEIFLRLTERWVLYFGILFILVMIFFPKGFIGTARDLIARYREGSSKLKAER
jgi:branched-chain amino acid transport system permease protein